MESADPNARLVRHILHLLAENNWEVRETDLGRRVLFVAVKDCEKRIVSGGSDDRYRCVCELAMQCGIDLE